MAVDRSPRGEGGSGPRPFLDPGGPAVDPSTSPVDEAWLAGGDLVDVVRATGCRDGWTEDEVVRAQAKITSASARKRPPSWLYCLARATRWVDVAPLPSPVAEARMPPWAKDLLLARVSRVPSAVRRGWAGPQYPCNEPSPRSPAPSAKVTDGLKLKRELGECAEAVLGAPTPPDPAGLRGHGVGPGGPSTGGVHGGLLEVKVESPSYSPVPGEDSVAMDYSGGEDDDGGTYLCPGWAIKRRLPHLVYTSAYQGDGCTGAYWASASPGEGVAMRVVDKPADTGRPPRGRALRGAVLALGGGPTLSASDRVRTGRGRGASARRPPLRTDTGDPLRDHRWGLVKRLGTAFGLCASGKPRTPDPWRGRQGYGPRPACCCGCCEGGPHRQTCGWHAC